MEGCDRKGRSVCLEELPAERILDAVEEMLPAALKKGVA
jgi:hypothetical protein